MYCRENSINVRTLSASLSLGMILCACSESLGRMLSVSPMLLVSGTLSQYADVYIPYQHTYDHVPLTWSIIPLTDTTVACINTVTNLLNSLSIALGTTVVAATMFPKYITKVSPAGGAIGIVNNPSFSFPTFHHIFLTLSYTFSSMFHSTD